ncbi:MAG: hypothetical protein R3C58_00110 [Parvularculaceae bacterium]
MRRSFLIPACLAVLASPALAAEPGPAAQAPAGTYKPASARDAGPDFVDLMAADFFENRLRLAQSRRIEAETARRYLSLPAEDRARYRADRKAQWRSMSAEERAELRGAATPRYSNLDDNQKLTFRKIASDELGAGADMASAEGDI